MARTTAEPKLPGLRADRPERLVAIEVDQSGQVHAFQRRESGVRRRTLRYQPWLILNDDDASSLSFSASARRLHGTAKLNLELSFESLSAWRDAFWRIRDQQLDRVAFAVPAEQFLVKSGWSLFRSMTFEDLVRVQLDIETIGLDPRYPDAEVIIITAAVNGRDAVTFDRRQASEQEMIEALGEWLAEVDPDVIEGHNIFNFDLPFLAERARRSGIELNWGRDGSPVRFGGTNRFKVGPRTIPYDPAYIFGRHVVDTYHQIQRYDIAGHLTSYGLKPVIEELGFARSDRTMVAGEDIASTWHTDPDRLIAYAVDDVRDTNLLSELTLPTEFYQTQILPGTLQTVATGGTGEKVNDLMVRAYIRNGESIPLPDTPRAYPGGYTAIREVGSLGPVVNADVESLYPSIMLSDRIEPQSDQLRVFLPLLETLTRRRLEAKKVASEASEPRERGRAIGMQLGLKILINSFYGYLGYGRGYFSDFDAASRVTIRGHEIIQSVEEQLTARGATIIEIDTDGLYFVPSSSPSTEEAEAQLIEEVSQALPGGIQLAHGGRWQRMLSLKLKNYALLGYDGALTRRGSALRSRREEPFLRDFLEQAIRHFMNPDIEEPIRDIYLAVAKRIIAGDLEPASFARVETITDATFTSESNRKLAEVAQGERIGERLAVYQNDRGGLSRVEDYANDEDRSYLLQRLRAIAERFRPIYERDEEFEYDFPLVTPQTDLEALRNAEPVAQPKLF